HHNPDHRDQGSPYGGAGDQGNIYDDLRVTWDDGAASFTELSANGSTEILQISLEEGEQAPITLAYDFVHEATSGNRANVDPRSASFDVLIEIGGDLPDEVPKEAPPPPPSDDTPGATPPGLPSTGTTGLLALIAAAAVVGGLLLRYASQQRQRAVHVTTGLPR